MSGRTDTNGGYERAGSERPSAAWRERPCTSNADGGRVWVLLASLVLAACAGTPGRRTNRTDANERRPATAAPVAVGTPTFVPQRGHQRAVGAASFSPDGRTVVTGSDDGTAMLWDSTTGALRATLQGHSDEVTAASFSPDGRTVATASRDHTAKLWDATSGALRATLQGHSAVVWAANFSPDGRSVVTEPPPAWRTPRIARECAGVFHEEEAATATGSAGTALVHA